ncbi:MAG: hypothetical protein AMXMBFR13_46130 [Phycisphaerae bacterium]
MVIAALRTDVQGLLNGLLIDGGLALGALGPQTLGHIHTRRRGNGRSRLRNGSIHMGGGIGQDRKLQKTNAPRLLRGRGNADYARQS